MRNHDFYKFFSYQREYYSYLVSGTVPALGCHRDAIYNTLPQKGALFASLNSSIAALIRVVIVSANRRRELYLSRATGSALGLHDADGDDDALDLQYLTSYKNATFVNGSFNPETRKAYVDEVEVAFAKANSHTTMLTKKPMIKKKTKPVMSKSLSNTPGLSSSATSGKKNKRKARGKKKEET